MDPMSVMQLILGEFYRKLDLLEDMVARDAVFPEAPNKINVAIGMRRVGKTYFLYQHIKKLIKQGVDKRSILFLNLEDDRLLPRNAETLAALIEAFYSLYPENHKRTCYLFLDEIQNVKDWPLVIRRFHDTRDVQIFLTGSSAKLLSKEIATTLRGRSLALELWPYSFTEFLRARKVVLQDTLYTKEKQDILKEHFFDYLLVGGFPEVTHYSADVRQKTLQEYLDIVIYRDIIERYKIGNPRIIKYMILSMIHGVGSPFKINKFYHDVRSQGYKTGKDVLYRYVEYIEDAFVAFTLDAYSTSLRKRRVSPKKIYAIDPGLVRALVLNYRNDLGRLFENVVYLDLRRLGGKVSYYRTTTGYDVDFVVETVQGERQCLQVTWNQDDAKTAQREQRALEKGMKELRKKGRIITLNSYLENGVPL